jgi:H+/gluconate symporter-like permease
MCCSCGGGENKQFQNKEESKVKIVSNIFVPFLIMKLVKTRTTIFKKTFFSKVFQKITPFFFAKCFSLKVSLFCLLLCQGKFGPSINYATGVGGHPRISKTVTVGYEGRGGLNY